MKITGRARGPFIKAYRSRLAKAGLDPESIEKAIAAFSSNGVKKTLKLKRLVIRRITEALEKSDRIVVVRGNNKIKVYSYEGHTAVCANAKTHKPWEAKRK